MRPIIILVIAIVVFAILAAVIVYNNYLALQKHQMSLGKLTLPSWVISFGSPNASTTLIEIFDLHCPACAYAHVKLDQLYEELLKKGKLRIIFIDFPNEKLHPGSAQAHQFLHCAYRQLGNKTFELIGRLYMVLLESGPKEQLELLQQYKCTDAPTASDFFRTVDLLAKDLSIEIRGTPTFIIIKNGTINVVVGADVARVTSLISQ